MTLLARLTAEQAAPARAERTFERPAPRLRAAEETAPARRGPAAPVVTDPAGLNAAEAALAELYERYSGMVHAVALRVLRDPRDAEEVTQDVFVSLWRSSGRYDPSLGSLGTYLLTMARNAAIGRIRARAARPQVTGDDLSDPEGVGARLYPAPQPDPTERLHVQAALGALAEDERRLLEGAFYEGLTHEALAERHGLPLGSVKSRIRRALLKLREKVEP
ncbi:MAG TPA: sigma-70 family RNA polymerase sigma factor [Deinococcales bacterium]|nr:sigma-70 family RNA polymerase sigma factor [Deinococcales bacterium]